MQGGYLLAVAPMYIASPTSNVAKANFRFRSASRLANSAPMRG
jgi:hypothetical protein